MRIKKVQAVYTGGGIWLFHGELTGGLYFLTNDYGDTLFLNETPEDFDISLYPNWQEEHTVKILMDDERIRFCTNMLNWLLKPNREEYRGGITDREISFYKNYMSWEH